MQIMRFTGLFMVSNFPVHEKITFYHIFSSLICYSLFIIVNLILALLIPFVFMLTVFFDKDKKAFAYLVKIFSRIFCFINFIQKNDFDFSQLQAPAKGERRIYVINHASMFDTVIMFLLPGPIKSLMKESYSKIPVIGWIARLGGNIILRENTGAGGQMNLYMNIVEQLENGSPIVIFPEGTRSRDSRIGRFYPGTFKIALDTRADLVPVVFDTWNVIRPGGLLIRDTRVTARVLDKINYEDIKDLSYKDISDNIRVKMIRELLEIRDERRKSHPSYYRHNKKYQDIDNQMRSKVSELEGKIK